jgi:hypothetical protein
MKDTMNVYLLTIIGLFWSAVVGYAQTNVLSHPVTLSPSELPMPFNTFIGQMEKRTGIRFFYHPDWTSYLVVERAYVDMPLRTVLDQVLEGSPITYTVFYDYGIILMKDPTDAIEREQLLNHAVAERKQVKQVTIGSPAEYRPNKLVTLRGSITDERFSSAVKKATVSVLNQDAGTTTNDQGYYELILPAGEYVVSFRHANYAEKIIDLRLFTTGRLNVELEEIAIVLEEVVVTEESLAAQSIGQLTLNVTELKRAPSFLGEVDIIRLVQTQAGVTTVGEVAAGFNVRGGGVDQNLVLYECIPVFNTSHAFGLFSAFNAEAVSGASFYKSGIPADYGGRVSSVLNVTAREGSAERWTGGGGIGLLSTTLHLEGPLKRDTTTLAASFRTTYSNWMLDLVNSSYASLENSSVNFYDGSLKLAHKFSSKSKLTFSGYLSQDKMRLTNDTLFQWNNFTSSVRWDKSVNEFLFYSVTVGAGRYSYTLYEPDPAQAFKLNYQITYPTLKIDFNHTRKRPRTFGVQATYYAFEPGTRTPTSEQSSVPPVIIAEERALEAAFYYSETFRWGERTFIDAGIRYAVYGRIGPGKEYIYQSDAPLEPRNIIDSVLYAGGELMKTYSGPEPRLSVRYMLNREASIKLGYHRLYQFIHLVSNTAAVTPVDVWQASNTFFRPQLANQLAAGYFRNLKDNTYELSGEVFYKHIENILEFKDGAKLILNDKLETALLSGTARAYGLELTGNKLRGRLQGGINYTYSRSLRQVSGTYANETINNGEWYPANFDQPHVGNVYWRYGISRRHFFTGAFTYRTGRPISLPEQVYYIDRIGISDFAERNTYRLPDYHRLDLAFVIEGNHKRKKLWEGTWLISAYNVYARENAYSVFFQQDESGILKPYQLSVIGTIIPTVTYNFKF